MKMQIINLVAMFFIGTIGLFANITEPVITTKGEKSFVVNTSDWKSSNLNVSIRDAKGNLILGDEIQNAGMKKYNLKYLPTGAYTVAIENEIKTVTQFVTISNDGIEISDDINVTYKPVINVHEASFDLNYLAPANKTTVLVYDENGNNVSTTNLNGTSINKRFVFDSLPNGEYQIVVANNDSYYYKSFKK